MKHCNLDVEYTDSGDRQLCAKGDWSRLIIDELVK